MGVSYWADFTCVVRDPQLGHAPRTAEGCNEKGKVVHAVLGPLIGYNMWRSS